MRINYKEKGIHTLPVLSVRGVMPFPETETRLEIGREVSIEALEAAGEYNNFIILLTQENPSVENPTASDLYRTGTIAKIAMKIKMPTGHYKVKLNSLVRVRVVDFNQYEPYFMATVETDPSVGGDVDEEQVLLRLLQEEVAEFGSTLFPHANEILPQIQLEEDCHKVSDTVAFYLKLKESEKIKYLEEIHVTQRMRWLLTDIEKEKQLNELEAKINKEVKLAIDKHQKEFYLREKVKVIQKELGDDYSKEAVANELREKIEKLEMPEVVKEKANEELRRFEMLPGNSSESGVVRTYLDWLVTLPWTESTTDNTDINHAKNILDEHHYGLEKVKDRILEYLAVKTMTGKNPSTILCLVGPPGVGKTSLATSIATALERKFVKISLGGVKDESEIRGHRRTYLGAMPGRLIQSMKKAGTMNPVFLLDEIDKMSSDYKGDPASAMLEVLDPEQNKQFSDHYLEESYDLSQVLFIATANYLENIPAPLRDRMDIVDVSSYTEQEKLEIAKNHLVKRQLKAHGLTNEQLVFEPEVLIGLIQYYTREAGVRQLERAIGAICRKAARELLSKNLKKLHIDEATMIEYMGKHKFKHGVVEEFDQIGVVTGLAFTQYGGDILPVEVTSYYGTGKIVLTGKLGDVMKESATTAVSFVKSNAEKFGIEPVFFKENDIHIHVPEGAIPKDGPSAGVTMATALISAFTKRPVCKEVGMTGEVTLRGRVLPIGGLKEKSIAAHRAGLKVVILPKDNEKDIEDIPLSVRSELTFVVATTMEDVLKQALR